MKIIQYNIYEIDLSNVIKDEELPENLVFGAILSPNEMNDTLRTIIFAPLCNQCELTPTTFLIDSQTRIRLDQISALNKIRVKRHISKIDETQIPKIKKILDEMLVK